MSDVQGILRRLDHYADCIEKGVHVTGSQLKSLVQDIRESGLFSSHQPAADGGFTAADMMDARQEGRKEAQQPAAVTKAMVRDALYYCPLDMSSPKKWEWIAAHINDALAAQPGGSDNDR